ncbi:hypothetical protein G6F22_021978 [Rhizopus arrhizus]|nr:hypothetical protein G6F22_021978 [Rhizopus arrhizus]
MRIACCSRSPCLSYLLSGRGAATLDGRGAGRIPSQARIRRLAARSVQALAEGKFAAERADLVAVHRGGHIPVAAARHQEGLAKQRMA